MRETSSHGFRPGQAAPDMQSRMVGSTRLSVLTADELIHEKTRWSTRARSRAQTAGRLGRGARAAQSLIVCRTATAATVRHTY